MNYLFKMRYIKILLNISLLSTAIFGDYVVFKSKYSESFLFRAVSDSIVHGFIGLVSSIVYLSYKTNLTIQACLYNIVFCTIISSLIDIDHFIVARSIYLKDLTNLRQRGIFHCTTFWVALTSALLLYSHITRKNNIYVLTFMLIIAFLSHHLRDANRRGLWLYPYGHTPPLSKTVYLSMLVLAPNLAAILSSKSFSKEVVLEYSFLV